MIQQEDNFDNGFEEIDIAPGPHKKSHYFLGQNGKTYDLSTGKRVGLRDESFINGAEYVQTGDWYDKNMPEDAFKDENIPKPAHKEAPPVPGHGSGFTYDPVTGLPKIAGLEADADGQIDYDNLIQVNKEEKKAAAPQSGFGYDHATGLPIVFGEPIDWDHDFVQFSGTPINVAMRERNLLATGEDWLGAFEDHRIEENIPEQKKPVEPEGVLGVHVTF